MLRLEPKPSIGNPNHKFLGKWYTKLNDFSTYLIKNIVKFCDNTIEETSALINSTETPLIRNIREVVLQNLKSTKRTLKQQKLKKFNYLKYKPAIKMLCNQMRQKLNITTSSPLTHVRWGKICTINDATDRISGRSDKQLTGGIRGLQHWKLKLKN